MKNTFQFKTLAEFLAYFKDEETCRKHFAKIRFAKGEYCPHCQHDTIYTFNDGKRYRCAKCKKDFTVITGTVFGETKLPLQKWFIAIYLLSTTSKGISSVQLAKHVGVTQKTGWYMDHRIRKAMKERGGKLFGTVEVDETYVGGESANMHKDKRAQIIAGGTGSTGKAILMGMLERNGRVIAGVVPDTKRETLQSKIWQHVEPGSTVFTDALRSYNGLNRQYAHETVDHAICYAKDELHTNSIESFWALFKRGYHGIYHQMSRKHMQRYVEEYAFRFNRRTGYMQNVWSDVVANMSKGTRLPYRELIA